MPTDTDLADQAARVVAEAEKYGLSLVCAESCTAGRLATLLSEAPGAGEHLHGGFVVYTKEAKAQVLGISLEILARKSAVCAEVACALAEGALARSPADIALAITGVAGPDPDEDGNPVGLVFVAAAVRGRPARYRRLDSGDIGKDAILRCAQEAALALAEGLMADFALQPADGSLAH
jgi:nicotinamide-nucleotide amidase